MNDCNYIEPIPNLFVSKFDPQGAPPFVKPANMLAFIPIEKDIGLLSRKMINALLYLAQLQGPSFNTFGASWSVLKNCIGYNSNDYEEIKRIFSDLMNLRVMAQSMNHTFNGSYIGDVTKIFDQGAYISRKNTLTFEWKLDGCISEQIMAPDGYSIFAIETQNRFKTIGGLALYEIFSQPHLKLKEVSFRRHWTWWAAVMQGKQKRMGEDGMQEFKYFNRDYLQPALSEVASVSGVQVKVMKPSSNIDQICLYLDNHNS